MTHFKRTAMNKQTPRNNPKIINASWESEKRDVATSSINESLSSESILSFRFSSILVLILSTWLKMPFTSRLMLGTSATAAADRKRTADTRNWYSWSGCRSSIRYLLTFPRKICIKMEDNHEDFHWWRGFLSNKITPESNEHTKMEPCMQNND